MSLGDLHGQSKSQTGAALKNAVEVNGLRLTYLEWNRSSHRRMLLLHGGGQHAGAWDRFAPLLSTSYRVIALDQRGHGDSDWSPTTEYTREAFVRDIAGVVEALHLAPLIIVGLSMGARNGLYFAARHPQLVQALVVTDIGLRVHDMGRKQMAPLFEPPHQLDSRDGFVERVRRAYPQMTEEQARRAVASNTRRLADGKWSWRYDVCALEELRKFEAKQGDEYHRTIRSVRVPTLIVRGVHSEIMTREDAATLASMIAGSRLVEVPNAGHRVMRDNPERYAAIVTEFLAAHGL